MTLKFTAGQVEEEKTAKGETILKQMLRLESEARIVPIIIYRRVRESDPAFEVGSTCYLCPESVVTGRYDAIAIKDYPDFISQAEYDARLNRADPFAKKKGSGLASQAQTKAGL